MKRQGRTWKKDGGNAMAHIIDSVQNNTLKTVYQFGWRKEKLDQLMKEKDFTQELRKLLIDKHTMHVGVKKGSISHPDVKKIL